MSIKKTGTKEWAQHNRNIFKGCRHGCLYCYGKANALRFRQIKKAEDWLDMKPNERSLAERPKKLSGRIMFASSHDILPEHIDITLKYLSGWLGAGNEILIVTKPHSECVNAICREFFLDFRRQITFRFTIGSMNDLSLKFWEPNAPPLSERLNALAYAREVGYKTSMSCEPFLDSSIHYLVERVLDDVTDTVWVGMMNGISRRVDTKSWSTDDWQYMGILQKCHTEAFIRDLYEHFKDNPKVRWKDSIRKMLGLLDGESVG